MDMQALRRAFAHTFGTAPALVAVAPGRLNLIGEHTDYNAGLALPLSIDRVARCALRANGTARYRLRALDLAATCDVDAEQLAPQPHPQQWANYPLGVVAALRARGCVVPGFDCVMSSDVPAGKGLASSAAITCALARGLEALFGLGLDDWELVRVGQAAENDFVGARTGLLDQFASVFGRADAALLLDCRSLAFEPIPWRLPGHALVVLDTGVKHDHRTSGYAERRADCERVVAAMRDVGWAGASLRDAGLDDLAAFAKTLDARALRRARFVIEENDRVRRAAGQLRAGDMRGFGESLLASHWGLSRSYEVSCPESDALVEHLEAESAVRGARQVGGGFGGCVLAVVEADAADDVIDAAQQQYFDLFDIALEHLDLASGPGARVEWREVPAGTAVHEGPDATNDRDPARGPVPAHGASSAVPQALAELPHRRLNILTGEWVLVSVHRATRPWQGREEAPAPGPRPSYDPACYLCPGNARAGGRRNPQYDTVYAFDNDFAALLPTEGPPLSYQEGLLVAEGEPGVCRVLCYSPDHARALADLRPDEIVPIVALWRAQYLELGARPEIAHVQIFENKGALMGCSNAHPHGQIWAQATVPEPVVRKGRHQREYAEATGAGSLLGAYLEQEIAAGVRTVEVSEDFVALVPWWAVWPFEVLLAPRRPMASLAGLTDAEVAAFAKTLALVTARYDRLFGCAFPYSAGIHQAPTDGLDHRHWHWHMEFKPPLLRSATVRKYMVGYELFAGAQRDLSPEAAAERLRGV